MDCSRRSLCGFVVRLASFALKIFSERERELTWLATFISLRWRGLPLVCILLRLVLLLMPLLSLRVRLLLYLPLLSPRLVSSSSSSSECSSSSSECHYLHFAHVKFWVPFVISHYPVYIHILSCRCYVPCNYSYLFYCSLYGTVY